MFVILAHASIIYMDVVYAGNAGAIFSPVNLSLQIIPASQDSWLQ
jgi:hypothetical protein